MFGLNLKTAWRRLVRQKMFSLVNVGGLAVGIAVAVVIFLFAGFELSYDGFHARADGLYRLRLDGHREGSHVIGRAKVFGFIGPDLLETAPEVARCARLINLQGIMGNQVMSRGDVSHTEERMYYADASVLEMFSFPLREGDPARALTEPRAAVLTESAARKYFGRESAMGRTLVLNGETEFLVTGVLEDVPANSHLKFDLLLSFATIRGEEYMLGWADFLTYVLLDPRADPERFEARLRDSDIVGRRLGADQSGTTYRLSLQPLRSIHLHSHLEGEAEANGSAAATYGLLIVALFVLVIAWINFVNLSAARALDRAREVGVRKAVGAGRGDLVRQFLLESLLVNLVAAVVAVGLVKLSLPLFSRLTGQSLSTAAPGNPALWGLLLGFFLLGGEAAALYPALVMSASDPGRVLKGARGGTGRTPRPRRLLIVFQFAAAVLLIIVAGAVLRQVSFMRSRELGIDIDRTLVVKAPTVTGEASEDVFDTFKSGLLDLPGVQSVTISNNIPGRESTWGGSIRAEADPTMTAGNVDFIGIDDDFLEAYGLALSAGRSFSPDFPSDREAVLLNESAVDRLGIAGPEAAVGWRLVTWRDAVGTVIGVVKNHHQLSLRHAQIPTVYFLRRRGDFYSIKTGSRALPATVAAVEREYMRTFPGNPFEYFFLDDYFDRQYQADRRFGAVFGAFAGLAIFTACLGLFALAAYAAGRRIKEIGIRKVLGASVPNLLALLSREFLGLVLIAAAASIPLAALGIRAWLRGYAYRMSLGWELFVLPTLAVVAIALLVVGAQTLKVALADPVKSLRYE